MDTLWDIPLIELNADFLKRTMSNGSWNQKGGLNFSYGYTPHQDRMNHDHNKI